MWQDAVIAVMNIVFLSALVPQIIKGFREKRSGVSVWTSLPTWVALWAIGVCFFTLGLRQSGAVLSLAGSLWLTILLQRLRYGR